MNTITVIGNVGQDPELVEGHDRLKADVMRLLNADGSEP